MQGAGPVQSNIGVATAISTAPPMQESVRTQGAFRGQTVSVNPQDQSKISLAAKGLGRQDAARADLATLSRRVLKQGQGATLQATKRIVEHYDKLPNMPQMAALQSLVEKMQSLMESAPREEASVQADQGSTDARTRSEVDNPDAGLAAFEAGRELRAREGSQEKGGEGSHGGSGGGASPQDILKLLQEMDGDVTHQYAALDIAREHFAAAKAPEAFQEVLASAARAFETPELMREVRAGFAAAKIAHQAAQTLETDPAAVRDAYRAMLREQKNFGQLFDAFRKFDVSKKFDAVIDVFLAAAGNDLASIGPSADRGYLDALLLELGKLKGLKSVLQLSERLVGETRRLVPNGEKSWLDALDTASRVLNFAAKATVSMADARGLLGAMAEASPASQVAFGNGLRLLHGAIPDAVMPAGARGQQVATLTLLQNNLVAAEEEAFAAGQKRRAAS